MEIGSRPVMEVVPASARATACSVTELDRHPIRYEPTSGSWLTRYGFPNEGRIVGRSLLVALINAVIESGSPMEPREATGLSDPANRLTGLRSRAAAAES